jgi:hypothetical protein
MGNRLSLFFYLTNFNKKGGPIMESRIKIRGKIDDVSNAFKVCRKPSRLFELCGMQ